MRGPCVICESEGRNTCEGEQTAKMAGIPITRTAATPEKQAAIEKAISSASEIPGLARIATPSDADALTELLLDPEISAPIYTLPKPINRQTVARFIAQHQEERAEGRGLLFISVDENNSATAYHDIQFWPQWAACELGGAVRNDRQGSGAGGGAAKAFGWLFDAIGVDLICETAALDNHRTARLLERLGFVFKGEIESTLPGGGARPSKCWEMKKEVWRSNQRD